MLLAGNEVMSVVKFRSDYYDISGMSEEEILLCLPSNHIARYCHSQIVKPYHLCRSEGFYVPAFQMSACSMLWTVGGGNKFVTLYLGIASHKLEVAEAEWLLPSNRYWKLKEELVRPVIGFFPSLHTTGEPIDCTHPYVSWGEADIEKIAQSVSHLS